MSSILLCSNLSSCVCVRKRESSRASTTFKKRENHNKREADGERENVQLKEDYKRDQTIFTKKKSTGSVKRCMRAGRQMEENEGIKLETGKNRELTERQRHHTALVTTTHTITVDRCVEGRRV